MDALGSGVVALAVLVSLGVGTVLGFLLGVYLGYRKMVQKVRPLELENEKLRRQARANAAAPAAQPGEGGDKRELSDEEEQPQQRDPWDRTLEEREALLRHQQEEWENFMPGATDGEKLKAVLDAGREAQKPENPILQLLGFVAGKAYTEHIQRAEYVRERLDQLVPVGQYTPERGEEIINEWVDRQQAARPDPPVALSLEQLRRSLLDMHSLRHAGARPKSPGAELRERLAVVHDINEGMRAERERIDRDTENTPEPQRTIDRRKRYREVEVVAGEILRSRAGER